MTPEQRKQEGIKSYHAALDSAASHEYDARKAYEHAANIAMALDDEYPGWSDE